MKDGPRFEREGDPVGEPTPEDVRRGRLAAVAIFVAAAVIQIAIFAEARQHPNSEDQLNVLIFDMMLAIFGPVVAIFISLSLPKRSRGAFWTTGLLCIFLTFLLWGVTCSMM